MIAARDLDAVHAAVAVLDGDGHEGLRLDVSDQAAWPQALATIDAGGPLHGLVTAAGELGPIGGQNFIHGFTASVLLFED